MISPPSAYQWGSWSLPHTCLPSGNTAGKRGIQVGVGSSENLTTQHAHTPCEFGILDLAPFKQTTDFMTLRPTCFYNSSWSEKQRSCLHFDIMRYVFPPSFPRSFYAGWPSPGLLLLCKACDTMAEIAAVRRQSFKQIRTCAQECSCNINKTPGTITEFKEERLTKNYFVKSIRDYNIDIHYNKSD